MSKITSRILLDAVIIFSVFYFGWWETALLVLFGIIAFDGFYEVFIAGLLLDILYGVRTEEFYGIWFVFTLFFSVMYLVTMRIKKNTRFYNSR